MERLGYKELEAKVKELWKENPLSENGRRSYGWCIKAEVHIEELLGKTITRITLPNEDETQDMILFECTDGSAYLMFHEQDCCESVEIEDIVGDLDILIGNPLMVADISTNSGDDNWGSHTWTFYHLATIKGYVDMRWYGESNGYYSEAVDFVKLK